MPDTVVIIVNYESGDRLRRCVASVLAQQPPPARLLVMDNGSTDGSARDLPSAAEVLPLPRNEGFAPALIAGLAASREPFVFTLNPDTELRPGCLAAAVAALERDHEAGAVAPRVLSAADPSRIDASGIGLTSRLGIINWDHGRRAADLDDAPHAVLGPLGGAALWRRVALERAGGWSRHFFLYWEDVDMALRLDRAGYVCRTVPDAEVLHEGSGIVGRWSALNVFYMVRNHWPCLMGALPGPLLARRAIPVLLAPLRAAALYALRGRPGAALAGLLCGAALVPAALWRRRFLTRTGTSGKAAARIDTLMDAADANRRVLKALA